MPSPSAKLAKGLNPSTSAARGKGRVFLKKPGIKESYSGPEKTSVSVSGSLSRQVCVVTSYRREAAV